jgi:RNA polymerase sigma factor for flagellar operon FliA
LSSDRPFDESQAWARYRRDRNKADFERLVEHYLPLVKVAAGRLAMHLPSFIREEDLYSAGCVGILSAVEHFDPGRDVRFETYALVRVRGAMLDELRSMDMLTRGVRERASRIRAAEQALRDEGRALSPEAVAERAGLTLGELCDTERALAVAQLASLDEESDEQGHTAASLVVDQAAADPLESLEREELLVLVKEEMTDKDRLLVVLYYHEELTLREIGAILGVSESRVSQMHTEMVKRLHYRVETDAGRPRGGRRRRKREGGTDGPKPGPEEPGGDWIA